MFQYIRREEKNDVSKDFHRGEKFEFRGQQRASRLSEKTRELESTVIIHKIVSTPSPSVNANDENENIAGRKEDRKTEDCNTYLLSIYNSFVTLTIYTNTLTYFYIIEFYSNLIR